jgi:hypothetical protein
MTGIDPGSIDIDTMSCPSATGNWCMALDYRGDWLSGTYNSSDDTMTWATPVAFDTGDEPLSVSCISSNFCMAVDNQGVSRLLAPSSLA